jgi:hypothetical protein
MRIHCSRCLSSRPTHFDSRSACIKCHSLFSGDYTRNYLMSCFTVDELRDHLVRHNVRINNGAEKRDLIELMMQRQQHSVNAGRKDNARVFLSTSSYFCWNKIVNDFFVLQNYHAPIGSNMFNSQHRSRHCYTASSIGLQWQEAYNNFVREGILPLNFNHFM